MWVTRRAIRLTVLLHKHGEDGLADMKADRGGWARKNKKVGELAYL